MPIRINLLAEQRAAEDLRRRDPVKRATFAGAALVLLVLVWGGYIQTQVFAARQRSNDFSARYRQIEARFQQAVRQQGAVSEASAKLGALERLATNRFLWGNVMDALQYSLVEDVRLLAFRSEQSYAVTPSTKPTTNGVVVTPGRPGESRETIRLELEARDSGARPGDQIFRYQEQLNSNSFFGANLSGKAELMGRSPIQNDPSDPSVRPFVSFTLVLRMAEKVRSERGP